MRCRWHPSAEDGYTDYTQKELELGFSHKGEDRLLLRLPQIMCHVIDDSSPLASWRNPAGRMADADADLIFLVRAFLMRQMMIMYVCAEVTNHDHSYVCHNVNDLCVFV